MTALRAFWRRLKRAARLVRLTWRVPHVEARWTLLAREIPHMEARGLAVLLAAGVTKLDIVVLEAPTADADELRHAAQFLFGDAEPWRADARKDIPLS